MQSIFHETPETADCGDHSMRLKAWQRRLLRGERLIIMTGTEQMEWHQIHGNHVFDVFDIISLIPLQSLPRACSPQLRCHQPPVPFSYVPPITNVPIRIMDRGMELLLSSGT